MTTLSRTLHSVEERRAWYLGALGIVRYVPRDAVDVTDSRDTEATAPTAGNQSVADVTSQVESPPAPKTAPPPASPQRKTAEKPNTPAADPASVSAPAEAQEGIQFRLAFLQPADELVVLSAMPPGARPGRTQMEMLANLLKALGQLAGELPAVELLDWPLSPGGDSSVGGARELLTAYLDVKHRLKPFRRALLMGEAAARVVSSSDTHPVGERISLACGAEGIVTHSLYDMERDPSLKRGTWEALRSLAGRDG